ncbi:MAG: ATP-binding protein [Pseudomonadota bacterium]
MKTKTINLYLFCSVFVLSIIPLISSLTLVHEILGGTLSLESDRDVIKLMRSYQKHLKRLKDLDPENELIYKDSFHQAQTYLLLNEDNEATLHAFYHTYFYYFVVLFGLVLFLTMLFAAWLSRKVSYSYHSLFKKELAKSQRLEELSRFDDWKITAQKIAHEIKNPLTPIYMIAGNLPVLYKKQSPEKFEQSLIDTKNTICQEIERLKKMIQHFSSFSKLPDIQPANTELVEYFGDYFERHSGFWPNLKIHLTSNFTENKCYLLIDTFLFNLCLMNLLNNAQEANPNQTVDVEIERLSNESDSIEIGIKNNGKPIPKEQCDEIFKMHFSTKAAGNNMGLGLPIVKKILLDHGGNISCIPDTHGVTFIIKLPLNNKTTGDSLFE